MYGRVFRSKSELSIWHDFSFGSQEEREGEAFLVVSFQKLSKEL